MARIITEASASASPTEQGSLDYSLWVIRRQNAVEDLRAWVKLTGFVLGFHCTNPLNWKWLQWPQPSKLDPIGSKPNTNTGDPKSFQSEHPEPSTPPDLIKKVASKQPLSTGKITRCHATRLHVTAQVSPLAGPGRCRRSCAFARIQAAG
jgi:hypothetical protein